MLTGLHTSAACAFILFFLLTPVSLQCWNATADECKKHKEFVLGYDLVGKGIDITTMKSTDNMLLDVDQWENSDGTCTMCNNAVLKGRPNQRLPLAVANWTGYPVCHQKLVTRLKYHAISLVETEELAVNNEWKTELNLSLEPNEKVPVAFAGSHSDLADFGKTMSLQDKFAFYYLRSSCSYYMLQVSKDPSLTENFKQALQSLPEVLDSDAVKEYKQLIETYGTHFTKRVYLGGLWKEATAIRLCEMQLDDLDLYTVSNCLKSEFTTMLGIPQVSHNTFQICGRLKKVVHSQGTFHGRFKDRYTEIKGGTSQSGMPLPGYLSTTFYKQWLRDVKEKPALVSYDIEPIYNLLETSNPRRTNLQSMIVNYVKDRVMRRYCPLTCKEGTHVNDLLSCSCQCVPNSIISRWCCANKRGLASVEVTIEYARGLYGDYFSATDAYVILKVQDLKRYTRVIWNSNSPIWFESFLFGYIDMMKHYTVLTVEIYDKDNGPLEGWIDDHLGTCKISLGSGYHQQKICALKHGSLFYHYNVLCGPYLKGSDCFSYDPQKPG